MASKHFLGKLLATVIVIFLLVCDTTPAASEVQPDGREKMLAAASVGIGGRVGWRKMNGRRVMMESVRGKFPVAGLSIRRSLRPFPSPPPPPVKSRFFKPPIYKPPISKPPYPGPPPPPPPPPSPSKQ